MSITVCNTQHDRITRGFVMSLVVQALALCLVQGSAAEASDQEEVTICAGPYVLCIAAACDPRRIPCPADYITKEGEYCVTCGLPGSGPTEQYGGYCYVFDGESFLNNDLAVRDVGNGLDSCNSVKAEKNGKIYSTYSNRLAESGFGCVNCGSPTTGASVTTANCMGAVCKETGKAIDRPGGQTSIPTATCTCIASTSWGSPQWTQGGFGNSDNCDGTVWSTGACYLPPTSASSQD